MALLTLRRSIGVALLTLAVAQPGAAQGLEYEVKAAFLFNFSKFVEWPPEALPTGEPLRICLLGDDPFGGALERTIAGDSVEGHPIAVEHVAADADPGSAMCQILFVPRSQAGRAPSELRGLGRAAVLTVGESPGFLGTGGIINLVIDGGRVRFDVNTEAATSRGLRISSKLLRPAEVVGNDAD